MSELVSLVTGASRGIGRAIALRLAARGHHVVVNFRSDEAAASQTLQAIVEAGGTGELAQADVSDRTQAKALVRAVKASKGRLDVLVNNAGVVHEELFFFTSVERFWEVMQTNLGGVVNVTKSAIPLLGKHKSGRVVNMASIAGLHGTTGLSAYATSKAAVIGLSKVLARELAASGVRVNVVAPGLVQSDMTDDLERPELHERALGKQPVPRMGTADEVAAVVEFLACDAPDYLTGNVVRVDGGSMIG
ncbi:MAG: 3-oxoacyl-ACP reductase family protein [Myxococcota bacterium]